MKKILLIVFLLISVGNLAFSANHTEEYAYAKWLHEKAEQGNAQAQYWLGDKYYYGQGGGVNS